MLPHSFLIVVVYLFALEASRSRDSFEKHQAVLITALRVRTEPTKRRSIVFQRKVLKL